MSNSNDENIIDLNNLFIHDDSNVIDLTEKKNKGVLKIVKKEGNGCYKPVLGDTVYVKFNSYLPNGIIFNTGHNSQDVFEFVVDELRGNVIEAWQIVIRTMLRCEVCIVKCSPPYTDLSHNCSLIMPEDGQIIFEIELLHWKGSDISENKDSSILKSIITPGEGYKTPRNMALCEVDLVGHKDGKIVEEKSIKFIMGEGFTIGLIPELEEAIRTFKLHEKAFLTFSNKLEKYQATSDEKLPCLEYIAELKNFILVKDSWEMNLTEKFDLTEDLRGRALQLFKIDHPVEASTYYKHLIDCWKDEIRLQDETMQRRNLILTLTYSNLAACFLKTCCYNEAFNAADEALKYDVENAKALYRRGMAHLKLKNYMEAENDLAKVIKIEPNNRLAYQKLSEARNIKKKFLEDEKKLYSAMLKI